MSPEFGFALFLTLLWGPTALWLAARVIRGQQGRAAGSFNTDSEAMRGSGPTPHAPEALASEGFWICSGCHSMNRPQARRCYSCDQAINAEGRRAPEPEPAPGPAPTTRELVPVMAEGVAGVAGDKARTNVVIAAPPAGKVASEAPARGSRRRAAVSPSEAPERASRRQLAVPALAVLPVDAVCPFLGFTDDPTTRCSFPDPRNRCHTPSAQGNEPAAISLRLITGKAGSVKPLEIGPEHQEALCLTAAHEQCTRFPAVPVAAGVR